MKGYRLTTLGKVVLFSLLFLIVISAAYTVKAFKYRKNNTVSLGNASASIVPVAQSNPVNVFPKTIIPYDYKTTPSQEIGRDKLKDTKLTIYFESDEDSFKDQYFDALDTVARIADILSDYMVKVEGNCATVYKRVEDNRDNIISYNLSLSRAKSVSNYLQKRGIDGERIIIIGNGSNNPIKSNSTEAERIYNRRVEISFTPNK